MKLAPSLVAALLAFDLGVLRKDDHEIIVREKLLPPAGYIRVASIFSFFAILLSDRRLHFRNVQPR